MHGFLLLGLNIPQQTTNTAIPWITTRLFDSLTQASKCLHGPISPVLMFATHAACLLDLLCFMPTDFLSGCPMILAAPASWDLQCLLGFTLLASHSSLSGYKIAQPPQSCLPHVCNTKSTCIMLSRSAVSWGRTLAFLNHSCINFCVLILGNMSLTSSFAL